MISRLPVSSASLHRRSLLTAEATLRAATLFPMFDRHGTVHRVMVVDGRSAEIRFFDPAETGAKIGIWGPIRLEPGLGTLFPLEFPLDEDQLRLVGRLWHFDPWWLLTDGRYKSVEGVEALKATNCVRKLPWQITRFWYQRDLSRLRWVSGQQKKEYHLVSFQPDMLPAEPPNRPAMPQAAASTGRWRLDPCWTRRGWLQVRSTDCRE